jgi:hypothetical protein
VYVGLNSGLSQVEQHSDFNLNVVIENDISFDSRLAVCTQQLPQGACKWWYLLKPKRGVRGED